jgi:Tfp pilus assembly protein PilX
MFMVEKLEKISSAKTKKYSSYFIWRMLRQRQKGSILISLIITMVVMAFLGAGMVYLTSTSTFQELFANNHARAYYVAESGGRYALSVIRDAYATDKTKLNAINNNQTFTLASNGGQFQITNWVQDGLNPETVTFKSVGTVNSGFLQAKRQLTYRVQTANQSGGVGGEGPTGPINFNNYVPTAILGGGKIDVLADGSGVQVNAASGGYQKVPTILYHPAWTYTGNYAAQAQLTTGGSGANRFWDVGLFVNYKINVTGMPHGYGISFFNSWANTHPSITAIIPSLPSGQAEGPLVLIWQNAPDTGLNWIAYAPINNAAITNIEGGSIDRLTILVEVIRKPGPPASNDIRVYFGDPGPKGTPDTIPINYVNRKAYPAWGPNPANDIKWPSVGTWPAENDYFTLINSDNTSAPSPLPIAKWIRNTNAIVTNTTSFQSDTTTITGQTIPNAVIRSTIMTGSDYSAVGLFFDAYANPKVEYYNLGILDHALGAGGGSDGSGGVIVSP